MKMKGRKPGAPAQPPEEPDRDGNPEEDPREDPQKKGDHFPDTYLTEFHRWVDEGETGLAKLRRRIMGEDYRRALKAYFVGSSYRWLGDPEEILNDFFVDRYSRPDFFDKWRRSGKRLRYWLINALHFYLKERARDAKRRKRRPREVPLPVTPDGEEVEFEGEEEDPSDRIHHAEILSILREAMLVGETLCRNKGLEAQWRAFLLWFRQEPFAAIGKALGATEARAAVMVRTGSRWFEKAFHQVLLEDGIPKDRIKREIRSMIDTLNRLREKQHKEPLLQGEGLEDLDSVTTIIGAETEDGSQPADELAERLFAEDGAEWLEATLGGLPPFISSSARKILLEGGASLRELRKIKEAFKRLRKNAATSGDRLSSMAGYFLTQGAALAHHGALITDQPEDKVRAALLTIAAAAPGPWSLMLTKALERLPDPGDRSGSRGR